MHTATTMPTAKILDHIYTVSDCTDCSDILGAAAQIWERVGGSLYQLLTYKAATKRMEGLAKRYAVLKKKQSATDAARNEKYYEVAQFERLFHQLLHD